MNTLRQLWRLSALPILLVLVLLIGLGVYFQRQAVRIQSQPLLIDVVPQQEDALVGEGLSLEEATESVLPETEAVEGPLAEALELIRSGKTEEGLTLLERIIEEDPDQDPRVYLTQAQVLIGLEQLNRALDILERLPPGGWYEPNVRFNKGLIFQRLGDTEQAEAEYLLSLAGRPTYYEASYNLGTLYLAAGKNVEAVQRLSDTLSLAGGKKRAVTLYNLGIAYARLGQYRNAEQSYLEAVNLVPQNLKPRINLAQIYRDQLNNVRKAQDLYEEVLRLDDGYAPAYFGLAMLKLSQQEFDEGEQFLQRALRLNPIHTEARKQMALLFLARGELDRAQTELVWLNENAPQDAGAYFYLGRIAFARQRYEQAAGLYRQAYELSGGNHLESLNNLGLSLKSLGKSEEASGIFLQALEKEPDYQSAHYNLGLIYLEEESYSRAQAAFEQAVRIDPEYQEAWYNLGFVLGLRGSSYQAIEAYEQALLRQPSDIKARLNLAVQYRKINATTRAVEQYRLVLSLNPDYASAWYNLALAEKDLDNFEEAEQAYRRAVELEPQESKYWQNLGVLYSETDRTAEAVNIFLEGLEIHPDSEGLRYNLALQHKKRGDISAAILELERLVSLKPQYLKGWLSLAEIYSDQDQHRRAAEALGKALALDPEDAYTRYELGKEYFHLGDHSRSLALYQEALNVIRDNAWIWYNLGKVLQTLQREDEADNAFDQALALDPNMARFVSRRLGTVEDSVQLLRGLVAEDPDNIGLRLQLAEQLLRSGDSQEALSELENFSRTHSQDPRVWLNLGGLHFELEEYGQAEQVISRARERFPLDGELALLLARVFMIQDKRDALPHLKAATELLTRPTAAWKLMGDVYYDASEYTAAVESYTNAKGLDPFDGRTILDLGKAYYRNKEYSSALKEFSRAVELLPDYSWAKIWLARAHGRLEEYEQAETLYREVVRDEPDFIHGHIGLGDLARKRSADKQAAAHYQKALEIDPFHDSTRRKLQGLQSD